MTMQFSGSSGLTFPDTSTQSSGKQVCKAWVNFNGLTSPGTIRASYNVSSITRNATGQFTFNFTNAMPDANYSVSGSVVGSTQSLYYDFVTSDGVALTAGSFRFAVLHQSATLVNQDYISVQVFGT